MSKSSHRNHVRQQLIKKNNKKREEKKKRWRWDGRKEMKEGSEVEGKKRKEQQKVRYNGYPGYRDNYNSAHARRSMACHEIGHTVGLRNRFDNRNSCMYVAGVSDRGTTTTAHDNNHINAHY